MKKIKEKKREKRKLFSLYSCANRTSKCVREKKKKNAMTSRNPGDKNSFATEMVSLSSYRGNWVKL